VVEGKKRRRKKEREREREEEKRRKKHTNVPFLDESGEEEER